MDMGLVGDGRAWPEGNTVAGNWRRFAGPRRVRVGLVAGGLALLTGLVLIAASMGLLDGSSDSPASTGARAQAAAGAALSTIRETPARREKALQRERWLASPAARRQRAMSPDGLP